MTLQVKSKNINAEMTTDVELAAGLATKYDLSNPSGFETPSQLNNRDSANRARGNHTGTQLASTISDLASTVRGTVLTGLSTVTSAAVTATDNILVAMGKLQALINGLQSSKYDASNPNSYETTTQLNIRDTNNRARANHTGTQLSNTISDFLTTVRSTLLTGLSLATSSAITATDSVLVGLGKLQSQINTFSSIVIPVSTGLVNAAGTSTAFARADHIHNTVVEVGRIFSKTPSSTSGINTYTSIPGFTWTPPAGTYTGDYNVAISSSSNNSTVTVAMFKNGVLIPDSDMDIIVRSNSKDMITGGCTENVFNGTTDYIEVRFQVNSGVATITNRILKLTRVG